VRLGLLLIYAEDFPTMLAFYRDVLGLDVTDVDPGPGHRPGIDWVQLQGDGGTIELFDHSVFGLAREFPLPRKNGVVITFHVEDVEAAVERLRRAAVDVEPIHRAEWGAAAHFVDPEGNELQVFETAELSRA
jgi:predicted enzyme related to lactoylglutathione lyase